MAMSAELDGEKSEISVEQVSFHLSTCSDCRQEFEQMQNLDSLFKRQKRREQIADLWSVIENRIGATNRNCIADNLETVSSARRVSRRSIN
ncbi:MAG: hypothetical protein WKF71_05220 [Pyrinomonadaceae bacterium]